MPPNHASSALTLPTEPNPAIFAGRMIADEVKEALISIFRAANTTNPALRSQYLADAAHHMSDYEEALDKLKGIHPEMDESYTAILEIIDHHLCLLEAPDTAENVKNASLSDLMPLYVHAMYERGEAPDNQLLETALRAHQGFAASERAREHGRGGMHQAGAARSHGVG